MIGSAHRSHASAGLTESTLGWLVLVFVAEGQCEATLSLGASCKRLERRRHILVPASLQTTEREGDRDARCSEAIEVGAKSSLRATAKGNVGSRLTRPLATIKFGDRFRRKGYFRPSPKRSSQ